MQKTAHYELNKPENSDRALVSNLNDNADIIDSKLYEDRAALVELVDSGAKNKAPNTATSDIVSNVAFTVRADGSVLANGTASAAAWFKTADSVTLPAGKYVICGGEAVEGTVNVRYVFSATETAGDIIADSKGDSTEFTLTESTTANCYVCMPTGRTADNVVVQPMICSKAAWDISHAYQPYRPSYQELYEHIVALENAQGD